MPISDFEFKFISRKILSNGGQLPPPPTFVFLEDTLVLMYDEHNFIVLQIKLPVITLPVCALRVWKVLYVIPRTV